MPRLVDVFREVKSCRLCAHELPLNPNPVLQVSRTALILIVGQAPGIRAHDTGLPFNDPSGDRLRGWLGLNREEFYDWQNVALLPMAFCYPGTGKTGDLPPPRRCADTWRERLLAELPDIRFTLLCGRYAVAWHLPNVANRSLTDIVKNWRDLAPTSLAVPHPSGRNNGWRARNPWFDLEVVPEIRKSVFQALTT